MAKAIVAINALIWIGFGPAFYFWPEAIGGILGIKFENLTGLADFSHRGRLPSQVLI